MNLETSQSTFLELELPEPASLQGGLLRYGGPQSGPVQSEFLESNVRRPWLQTIFVLPEIWKTKFGKVGMLEPSRHLRMILNRLWRPRSRSTRDLRNCFPTRTDHAGGCPSRPALVRRSSRQRSWKKVRPAWPPSPPLEDSSSSHLA